MKTLIKATILSMVVIFAYSYSFAQNDTSKTAVGKAVDKVEDVFTGDHKDIDHNHSALMERIDDLLEKVQNMNLSGDFDKDYAEMMIEYNQAGIDMAQTETMKGNNANLKEKARLTIDQQKEENDQLRAFLKDFKESGKKHDVSILKNAVTEKLNKMHQVKITGDVDKDFAKLMNMHREYAIDLHKLQLEHGMSAELKEHARKSITEQEKDMADLKEFNDVE